MNDEEKCLLKSINKANQNGKNFTSKQIRNG